MKVCHVSWNTLKLHFMKCSERKISQCILPFKVVVCFLTKLQVDTTLVFDHSFKTRLGGNYGNVKLNFIYMTWLEVFWGTVVCCFCSFFIEIDSDDCIWSKRYVSFLLWTFYGCFMFYFNLINNAKHYFYSEETFAKLISPKIRLNIK